VENLLWKVLSGGAAIPVDVVLVVVVVVVVVDDEGLVAHWFRYYFVSSSVWVSCASLDY
jgi:hypothetical protein